MTVRNFDSLLKPASVALLGASTKAGSVGAIVAQNLLSSGFAGPIWFVNPKFRVLGDHFCYASVAALPAAPDLAVLATPPQTVPGLISELGAKGTRAAVVITAGIRGDLKQGMLDAARPYTLRVQGPNCVGLMLPRLGLNASFSFAAPAGDIAFLSQSGALITGIVDWARGRNIGFSHVVSLGDMADADFGDFLDYLAAEPSSRAILLYMEAVTNAPKFVSAARRAARSKPVIVVKAGRSATGAKAAQSHTGAMAGSDFAYEAAFRRAGVLRVKELDDLFSAAEMLSRHPSLSGDRLAILTNGGGAGVLATDCLQDLDGSLAQLTEITLQGLEGVLPPTWSHGNPVDIIGDADAKRYRQALEVLLSAKEADAILVMNCPTALTSSTSIGEAIVGVVEQHRDGGRTPKPVFTTWLGDAASREARARLAAHQIASFATPAEAIDGFMQLVRHARAQEALLRTPPSRPTEVAFDVSRADAVIAAALKANRSLLSEFEGKELLAAYGIPVVPTEIGRTPADVGRLAKGLAGQGDACVVKILSDDISHKSDVGGVRLGLRVEDAERAADEMLKAIAAKLPDARLAGFTVQPMIRRAHAHELILGMSVDATFGPLLMFGAGGTAVEVVRDIAHGLPPLDHNLAHDMMRQTRVWRLLQGYRDHPAADLDAVADALVKLSYLIAAHPEIRELDINPLLADATGVMALDTRVGIADARALPRQPLAIRPYPSEWAIEVHLPTVGDVSIRPIRPQDERLYEQFFAAVTTADRRLRFFGAGPNLTHGLLARLTQIDYAREMAFVAIDKSSQALLGVVRMIADPDYTRAEYAILVRSDLKGRGLGSRLMQHLIDYGKSEGLKELNGFVLVENTSMLQMCRQLGFVDTPDSADPGLRQVRLGLRER
jgi:acetyltransferase